MAQPIKPGSTYTVQAGDTLWDIAQRAYADPEDWDTIYNANKQVIGNDPNLIKPGQVLHIPAQSDPNSSKSTVTPQQQNQQQQLQNEQQQLQKEQQQLQQQQQLQNQQQQHLQNEQQQLQNQQQLLQNEQQQQQNQASGDGDKDNIFDQIEDNIEKELGEKKND